MDYNPDAIQVISHGKTMNKSQAFKTTIEISACRHTVNAQVQILDYKKAIKRNLQISE